MTQPGSGQVNEIEAGYQTLMDNAASVRELSEVASNAAQDQSVDAPTRKRLQSFFNDRMHQIREAAE